MSFNYAVKLRWHFLLPFLWWFDLLQIWTALEERDLFLPLLKFCLCKINHFSLFSVNYLKAVEMGREEDNEYLCMHSLPALRNNILPDLPQIFKKLKL